MDFQIYMMKENLVFSAKNAKIALCSTLVASLLSSCAWFDNSANTAPNHSWEPGKNYGSKGQDDAELATMAYSQGNFEEAEKYVIQFSEQKTPFLKECLMWHAVVCAISI